MFLLVSKGKKMLHLMKYCVILDTDDKIAEIVLENYTFFKHRFGFSKFYLNTKTNCDENINNNSYKSKFTKDKLCRIILH